MNRYLVIGLILLIIISNSILVEITPFTEVKFLVGFGAGMLCGILLPHLNRKRGNYETA